MGRDRKEYGPTYLSEMTGVAPSVWHVRESTNSEMWSYLNRDGRENIVKNFFDYEKEIEELKEYFLSFYYQETDKGKIKYKKMLDLASSGVIFKQRYGLVIPLLDNFLFAITSEAVPRYSTYEKIKELKRRIENEK